MSDEEWGTKSDTDMIKNIKDKARAESPLGLFENFRKSKTTATEAAKEAAGAIEHMATSKWDNMSRASEDNDAVLDKASIMTKEKRATTSIAEEAVLKMVANIDKTAVSAECMQLTQVGFIDILRKINQEKFLMLKEIKSHFATKVDKVVMAKDYQIKCQRVIAIEAAKKIVSETTKDSSELFNREVTKLMIQYSRILDLVEYFETVVKQQSAVIAFQEKIISKLSLRMNAGKIDEEVIKKQTSFLRSQQTMRDKDVSATFSQIPKILYKYEPFEFYGGNFSASQEDK